MTEEAGRKLETQNNQTLSDEANHPGEETPLEPEPAGENRRRSRLPWIGGLANPYLGPMAVLNENGYLVPLLTAGDLLRGCKYFWQESQE